MSKMNRNIPLPSKKTSLPSEEPSFPYRKSDTYEKRDGGVRTTTLDEPIKPKRKQK